MKVAIIDDERIYLDQIKILLKEYDSNFDIETKEINYEKHKSRAKAKQERGIASQTRKENRRKLCQPNMF